MTSQGKRERPHGVLVRCIGQVSLPLKGEVDGGWRKWRGKGGRCSKPAPAPFLCSRPISSFCIPVPLPTWTQRRLLLCFYLLASGAALAVTGHCGWMCVRNASAWLYMSTEQLYLCFCLFTPSEAFCQASVFCAYLKLLCRGLIK